MLSIRITDFYSHSCQGEDWTAAFAAAIQTVSSLGGGTIYIPSGEYPSRSIELLSHTALYLEAGAIIRFLDTIESYDLIETESEGRPVLCYKPLIFADHAEDIAIRGQGTLDGNGGVWWKAQHSRTLTHGRPPMLHFQYCQHICLEDITILRSPFWTVHPLYCDDMLIRGVTIQNPPDSPNTDGIDPDSTRNLRIVDCTIDVGDDCIAIKSGTEEISSPLPSENITITGCTMLHGHGGVVLGSEMSGGIRNVVISNCIFYETDRGIRIKTRRRRGGVVEDIIASNIVMDRVLCPFVINLFYWGGRIGKQPFVRDRNPHPVDTGTPLVRNILLDNIIAKNVTSAAGFLCGLPEQPIENIQLNHCTVSMDPTAAPALPAMLEGIEPMQAAGLYVRNATNVTFNNMVLKNVQGTTYDLDSTAEISIR